MRFGYCSSNFAEYDLLAKYDFDYLENSVSALLCPNEGAQLFAEKLQFACNFALPITHCCSFIPKELPICGPHTDLSKLKAYTYTALARAAAIGVGVIVLGSGNARRIPEGFPRGEAMRQIADFCQMSADFAAQTRIIIVIEPLNSQECNVFTSVQESAEFVRKINHPNLRLLVDSYHWGLENGTEKEILDNADLFAHVHVATWPSRRLPGVEKCPLDKFIATLKKSGYNGTVSFEGVGAKPEEMDKQLPAMLQLLRQWAE